MDRVATFLLLSPFYPFCVSNQSEKWPYFLSPTKIIFQYKCFTGWLWNPVTVQDNVDQYFRLLHSVYVFFLSIQISFQEPLENMRDPNWLWVLFPSPVLKLSTLKKKKNHILHHKWSSPQLIVPPQPPQQSQFGVRWLRSHPVWAFISLKWANQNNLAAICYKESNGGRGCGHCSDNGFQKITPFITLIFAHGSGCDCVSEKQAGISQMFTAINREAVSVCREGGPLGNCPTSL